MIVTLMHDGNQTVVDWDDIPRVGDRILFQDGTTPTVTDVVWSVNYLGYGSAATAPVTVVADSVPAP